jgi:hypothetical protein
MACTTNAAVRYRHNVETFGPRVAFLLEQHRPFLCRLGWHIWRRLRVEWPHALGEPTVRVDECRGCGLERRDDGCATDFGPP